MMWWYRLLPAILNMSLAGGIAVVFVILARIPLRKSPKIFSYALWAVVLFRLVCPVSFSSVFSVMGLLRVPAPENGRILFIPVDIVHTEYPQADLPLHGINEAIDTSLPQGAEQLAADPLEAPVTIATMIWFAGMAMMLAYSVASLLKLRRALTGAVRFRDNIFLADHIPTPFVLGVLRPRIYIPLSLPEKEHDCVILHEQIHIRRLDHIVKIVAFAVLTMHWFNPLVWAAFILCMKDMEMSCDERVLREMGEDVRVRYSESLLSLSAGRRIFGGSPLAFGEGSIKERIRNMLDFKKTAAWIVAVSIVFVAALSLALAANGAGEKNDDAVPVRLSVPELLPGQQLGTDMTQLDYASDDIVIFHDYYGMFVYDLEQQKIVRSLDLGPIGCNFTQGDNHCIVSVSRDGSTVRLHPMSSESMYVWSVRKNTLAKTAYEPMEESFSDFVDTTGVKDHNEAGKCSRAAVKFDNGDYGYLYTTGWTLDTLYYIRGDRIYKLFDFEELYD